MEAWSRTTAFLTDIAVLICPGDNSATALLSCVCASDRAEIMDGRSKLLQLRGVILLMCAGKWKMTCDTTRCREAFELHRAYHQPENDHHKK
jgi:hypothetical protein